MNKKDKQLGMPFGTAQNRLKKSILFFLSQKCKLDICYRCKNIIDKIEDFSIEHKNPWLGENTNLFWDLDNIAFSHKSCNISARRNAKHIILHGTAGSYKNSKCRCGKCKEYKRKKMKEYRLNKRHNSTVA